MIKTIELIFPVSEETDVYAKDAKCLSDMIENFQTINKGKIKVTDIKYCFDIISQVVVSPLQGTPPRNVDIPLSAALVLYEDVK